METYLEDLAERVCACGEPTHSRVLEECAKCEQAKLPKTYLGDGVSVKFDGYALRLYLSDKAGSEIVLEPRVMSQLDMFWRKVRGVGR